MRMWSLIGLVHIDHVPVADLLCSYIYQWCVVGVAGYVNLAPMIFRVHYMPTILLAVHT